MKNLQPMSNRVSGIPGSSLAHLKTQSLARDEEEKTRRNRIKGAILLTGQFLADQGYTQTLQMLQQESSLSLADYCVADNIDLITVMHEYEQFYQFKFQKKPKFFRSRGGEEDVKVITEGGEKVLIRKNKNTYGSVGQNPLTCPSSPASATPVGGKPPAGSPAQAVKNRNNQQRSKENTNNGIGGEDSMQLGVEGTKVTPMPMAEQDNAEDDFFCRTLKPLPVFPTAELRELAATITREIMDVNPSVRFNDIAELDQAKQLLREAVLMPVRYPELFEGIVRPWKGILLFGPPGTGKTMLAKAVATECRTTFFNITASSVVSKWRGDSEKLIRMLFELAVHYAPSTIFIDEIDSLMSARSSEGEHEGSRRMKTELLTQMDGLSRRKGGDIVFVLAATNVPWDLDAAMLRRLEKRILVTLPTTSSRRQMFQYHLSKNVEDPNSFDWDRCAELTEKMSGADVDTLCREAKMRSIRKLIVELEKHGSNDSLEALHGHKLTPPNVSIADVEASAACTKSSVGEANLKKYDQWAQAFGSGMSL
eukprot:gene4279-3096_t